MAAWNVTVDDTSPIFTYHPYGEPCDYDRIDAVLIPPIADGIGPSNGWSTWFSQTGYNTAPGEAGKGKTLHITSLPNAIVQLQFYGAHNPVAHIHLSRFKTVNFQYRHWDIFVRSGKLFI